MVDAVTIVVPDDSTLRTLYNASMTSLGNVKDSPRNCGNVKLLHRDVNGTYSDRPRRYVKQYDNEDEDAEEDNEDAE